MIGCADGECRHGMNDFCPGRRQSRLCRDVAGIDERAAFPGQVAVGFVSPVWYVGGAERHLLTLWSHLDPKRVRNVGLVVALPEQTSAEGLAMIPESVPVSFGPDALRRLGHRCEIVVTWGNFDRSPLRETRARIVSVSHGDDTCLYTRDWIAEAARFTDQWVGVSRAAADVAPQPCEVIHNGVDPKRVLATTSRAEMRRRWGVPRDAIVVGYLGRYTVNDKRADLLPQAIPMLDVRWWGVLHGDGYQADLVRELAGRCDRVIDGGVAWDVGAVLAGIDVLVNPSRIEGFGLSAVEAILAGVPVVSTPAGVFAEFPDLVRTIPLDCTPEQLAAALVADDEDSMATRIRTVRSRQKALGLFTAQAFGASWTDYLTRDRTKAPAQPAPVVGSSPAGA